MAAGRIQNKKQFYIVHIIGFLVMIGFSYLPPIGQITPIGMRALGIFIGCLIGWTAGYIITSSLLGLTVYALYMPEASFSTMLSGMFGSVNMLMVATSLLFAYALQRSGLLTYIASKLLKTKFATKSPWHISVIMWFAAMICTVLIVNSFAVVIMLFTLWYDIIDKMGVEKKSSYSAFTLIGMAVLASISVGVAPYSSAVLVCLAIMSGIAPQFTYSLPIICGINFLVVFCVFLVFVIVAKVLFQGKMNPHLDMEKMNININVEEAEFTAQIGVAIGAIILLLVILIVPIFLPKTSAAAIFLNRIGGNGCFMFTSVIMMFIIFGDKPMFDLEDAMKNGCRWDAIFLLGTALYITSYLTSADSGVLATLSTALKGSIGGFGVYAASLIVMTVGLIFTNCASNGAAMQLFTPLYTLVMLGFNINPAIAIGLMAVVLDHGLILPSGSAIGAYLHANSEHMTTSQVFKYTGFGAISLTIIIAAVGLPIALALA